MKKIGLCIAILCIIIMVLLLNGNHNKITDNNVSENDSKNRLISILVKRSGEDNFRESTDNTWINDKYFYLGSRCKNLNGKEIKKNIIKFNSDRTITVRTNESVSCYLYFEESTLLVDMLKHSPNIESEAKVTAREDVVRRFQGSATEVNDNYICFGTNNLNECTTNADKYMYRVIGFAIKDDDTISTETGQVKLIKKEALEQGYQWANTATVNIQWPDTLIYKGISEADYLKNKTYIPDGWETKIADHSWYYGDTAIVSGLNAGKNNYLVENGKALATQTVYCPESNRTGCTLVTDLHNGQFGAYELPIYYKTIREAWTNKIKSKVGIITMSDYILSVKEDVDCISTKDICKAGWIHLDNNDSVANSITHKAPPDAQEFTMIHHGLDPWWNGFSYHTIHEDGANSGWIIDPKRNFSARPVIFLVKDIMVLGTGTYTDPYRIMN